MKIFWKKDIKSLSDTELLAEYKKSGKSEMIGELFTRYNHLVYGVCLKYLKDRDLASDLLQEVFEKILLTVTKHEIENFSSWLHTVARNQCLMYLRKHKYTKEVIHMENIPAEDDLRAEKTEKELEFLRLEKAIDELKKEQRICIKLFYLEEKCYTEISDITGYDLKKVKSYIQNGKRNLKINLMNNYDESVA